MIAAYALLTCAFVPGPVLAGASGLLFGTELGTAVAILSATLGPSAAFLIARALARRSYGALVRGRLRDWTARIEGRGFLAVLHARIVPGLPFALISYAAGLTRVRLRDFAGATAIGALPRALAYAALGGSIGNYSSPQALVAIGVLVAMATGGAALLWHTAARPVGQRHKAALAAMRILLRAQRVQPDDERHARCRRPSGRDHRLHAAGVPALRPGQSAAQAPRTRVPGGRRDRDARLPSAIAGSHRRLYSAPDRDRRDADRRC